MFNFVNCIVYFTNYQILDGTTNYQMSKNSAYPSKHLCLCKIFHKENTCRQRKVIAMAKFANHYKKVFEKKWATRVAIALIFFNLPEKTCQQINITAINEWDYYSIYVKASYKCNEPKSLLFCCWFLSPSFDDHQCTCIRITILCLKVKQKQV